jgi:uncharacterized protein
VGLRWGGEDEHASWHGGVLVVATGNTTGVFYQVGGGYADAITRHIRGYEAIVAATAGSADNLLRLGSGDAELAFTFADVAADAVRGEGAFAGAPRRFKALAALYRNYTHLIVRTDAGINAIADLRGKRISTGTPNSGTEFIALRLLRAAGFDPDKDVVRKPLSLPATTTGLANGSLDATFWTAGLPTVGITGLLDTARSKVRFLPVDSLLPKLDQTYPNTYVPAKIPTKTYELPGDVATVAVSSMIAVDESMPEQLAYDLTALIFSYQKDLTLAHSEWGNVRLDVAPQTGVVALHPGAERYYRQR